ncbi:MAG TPA: hypothetical protein VGD81_21015 [Opitutaceae bacterium]
MAYKAKKVSPAVRDAKPHLAAMQQIDKDRGAVINYGDEELPLTVVQVEAKIKAIEDTIALHNQLLSQVDALKNKIESDEKVLAAMLVDTRAAAKRKFGRDSSELEQLGGTRSSERPRARTRTGTEATTAA